MERKKVFLAVLVVLCTVFLGAAAVSGAWDSGSADNDDGGSSDTDSGWDSGDADNDDGGSDSSDSSGSSDDSSSGWDDGEADNDDGGSSEESSSDDSSSDSSSGDGTSSWDDGETDNNDGGSDDTSDDSGSSDSWDNETAENNDDGWDNETANNDDDGSSDSDSGWDNETADNNDGAWDNETAENNDDGWNNETANNDNGWDNETADNNDGSQENETSEEDDESIDDGTGDEGGGDGDTSDGNDDGSGDDDNNSGRDEDNGSEDSSGSQATSSDNGGFFGGIIDAIFPEEITVNLERDTIQIGESTEVSGKLEGEDTSGKQVEILINGRTAGFTTTNNQGRYSYTLRPETVGTKTVKVKTENLENQASLEVTPTVRITSITTSSDINANQRISVCPRIVSQVEANVELYHNGQKVGEKTGDGDVCFQPILEKGSNKFRAVATVQGDRDTREITRTTGLDVPGFEEGESPTATGGFYESPGTWGTVVIILGLITALAAVYRQRILETVTSQI